MKRALVGLALAIAAAAAGETVTEVRPVGPGGADWAKTYSEAAARAQKESKLVFVEFDGPSCGNCSRMDALLYPATQFALTIVRTVPVKLEIGKGEALELQKRYGITTPPATLVLSPGGALVFRLEGFDNPGSFYEHLAESLKEWDALNLRIVREAQTIEDPKAELEIGAQLYRRFDPQGALPRLERAAASPTAAPDVRDAALAYLASARLELGDVVGSKAAVEKLLQSTKNPVALEKAELFRAEIAIAGGDRAEAARRLDRFLVRHKDSKFAAQAREMRANLGPVPERKGK